MIPRTTSGRGFRGAGLYYLHDKMIKGAAEYALHDKGKQTANRVRFTHTLNMSSDNPERAISEMCWTANHQNDIKRAHGGSGAGRKLSKPVYAFSLSWHPDQEPTPEQMIEAGKSALKALKMTDYQCLMVAHNDTEHPHIHMVVNRVHPVTGIAHNLSKDQMILSKWALKYEKRHGKVLCQQREVNLMERRKASIEKSKGKRKSAIVKDRSMSRDQWKKLKSEARFKDGVPDINADIVRDEAEVQKRLLDTPEAELQHLATARQQVLSGKETLVFRPKGAKGGKSKAKTEAEIEERAAAIKKQLQAKIDHDAAQKIDTLQPKDWQQKLAKQLGPQVTKAWFADAMFEKDELTFPNRFKADYVKSNYAKGVEAALGKVKFRVADQPAKAPQKAKEGPAADPRAEAFAQWEIRARNALQDRQNEERAKLGDKQQRQKLKTEERIERHYGKDRRADEKALKEVAEKRAARPSRAADRTLEAEQIALEMNLSSSGDRIQDMLDADSRSFESAWLDLNTTHATETAALSQQISYGISAGYEIPSLSPGPSQGIGFDRVADPGWGRG